MRLLIVYLILFNSCAFKPIRAGKCNVWEYTNNCEEEEMTTATFSDNENRIKVPIIKYAIPRKIIDSLCYEFISDYNTEAYGGSHVKAMGFGEYYYADSLLEISVYEMNEVNGGEYSFECYVDDEEYELGEHNSYKVIYVPQVGVVYAASPVYNIIEVAALTGHCRFSKKEWKKKYREYTYPYLITLCK